MASIVSGVLFLAFLVPTAYSKICDTSHVSSSINAYYNPGVVTVDGKSSDWNYVEGRAFRLKRAIGPPEEYPEGTGDMLIKAVHDGQNLYVLVQIPGHFLWSAESPGNAPSVSLMFGIGDNATFERMGGCPHYPKICNPSNCRGHEVDLMQFKLNTAIPGRRYGGNEADNLLASGNDRIGQLSDMFGWNPHCMFFDSIPEGTHLSSAVRSGSGARNDWAGAWGHSSINTSSGLLWEDAPFGNLADDGDFVFEFLRPLQTQDKYNQDAQFEIGSSHRFGAAAWYPENEVPWSGSLHYVISCDWVSLHIHPASSPEGSGSEPAGRVHYSVEVVPGLVALVISVASMVVLGLVLWRICAPMKQKFVALGQTEEGL